MIKNNGGSNKILHFRSTSKSEGIECVNINEAMWLQKGHGKESYEKWEYISPVCLYDVDIGSEKEIKFIDDCRCARSYFSVYPDLHSSSRYSVYRINV